MAINNYRQNGSADGVRFPSLKAALINSNTAFIFILQFQKIPAIADGALVARRLSTNREVKLKRFQFAFKNLSKAALLFFVFIKFCWLIFEKLTDCFEY